MRRFLWTSPDVLLEVRLLHRFVRAGSALVKIALQSQVLVLHVGLQYALSARSGRGSGGVECV